MKRHTPECPIGPSVRRDAVPCVIGVDLDNTIAGYDGILFRRAVECGWIPPNAAKGKRAIRDQIRRLPDGEMKWQALQAHIYGPGMKGARLMAGVKAFLDACREHGALVFIVSHKTQYAAAAPEGPDLRETARAWLERRGWLGLSRNHIFFEATRAGKLARIRALGCTHFVDDLEETFLEPDFPANVEKILYAPDGAYSQRGNWLSFDSWKSIRDYFTRSCWHG
ncbi:MAG TPA: hypothetical protein PKO36_11160 [Candidatus Hydrogenedentes bacterium]|nr:hypothetical protein [Candidatus Hydrogenedentota bacterium]HOV74927.1 hypothetical protein [Candidatus Hydrogenedentota bacterium]HPC18415.1 hypothetical protein [Candidatus Hydrogenedentota bacterium]HRT21796.1 hypothetical protein [Candidatus Hydrogenedentota bacterium]HRT66887.1 hypothetical protein [Candidatus Hydrogenedentota bacterium]